jgi:hypothetical protein
VTLKRNKSQIVFKLPVSRIEMINAMTVWAKNSQICALIICPVSIDVMSFQNTWNRIKSAFLACQLESASSPLSKKVVRHPSFWSTSPGAISLWFFTSPFWCEPYRTSNALLGWYRRAVIFARSTAKALSQMSGVSFKWFAAVSASTEHICSSSCRSSIEAINRAIPCFLRWKAFEWFLAQETMSCLAPSPLQSCTGSGTTDFIWMFAISEVPITN